MVNEGLRKIGEEEIALIDFDNIEHSSIWKEISILSNNNGGVIYIISSLLNEKEVMAKFLEEAKENLNQMPIIKFVRDKQESEKLIISIFPSYNLTLCKEVDGYYLYKKENNKYIKLSELESEQIKKEKWNKCFFNQIVPIKFNPYDFSTLSSYFDKNKWNFDIDTLKKDNLINGDNYISYGLSLFSEERNDLSLIFIYENLNSSEYFTKIQNGNLLDIFKNCLKQIKAKYQSKLDDSLNRKIENILAFLLSNISNKKVFSIALKEEDDYLYFTLDNDFEKEISSLKEGLFNINNPIYKIMEKCGFLDFDNLYSSINENSIKIDCSSFSIKLLPSNNKIEAGNMEFIYPKLNKGNRDYDEAILSFCLKSPKTREEIQNLTPYKSKSSFLNSILNPLLEAKILLPTTSFKTSPNNKYFLNLKKVKIKDGHQ